MLNSVIRQRSVAIPIGSTLLPGEIYWPDQAWGMVLFAHGSGSNRFSPRNQKIAEYFYEAGLGSCLLDLLTVEEQETPVDLAFLGQRFSMAAAWLTSELPAATSMGFYGASTGASVALLASIQCKDAIQAIVSRGGRPDLAGHLLHRVSTPTLLLVGSQDTQVESWNREALAQLPPSTAKALRLIRGAGHLFEGAGQLAQVANLSLNWYRQHLKS